MLQWLDLDDMDGLEAMAEAVLPQLIGLQTSEVLFRDLEVLCGRLETNYAH